MRQTGIGWTSYVNRFNESNFDIPLDNCYRKMEHELFIAYRNSIDLDYILGHML